MDKRKKGLILFFLAFIAILVFNFPVIEDFLGIEAGADNNQIFNYLHLIWLAIIVVIGVVTFVSRVEKQTPLDD